MKSRYHLLLGFLLIGTNALAEEPTFETIQQWVNQGEVPTVEAFLGKLPSSLRSNFTLMRESKSSQQASGSAPRAILFGETGKLLVAFNGDPEQKGYNTVELIQFREPGRFEFRALRFPKGGKPELSGANPARCLECHGDPPRPRWGNYFTWKGAYGEVDDALVTGSAPWTDFRGFTEKQKDHPRYRTLIRSGEKENPYAPFHESSAERRFNFTPPDPAFRNLSFMPNTRFSMLLARLVSQDISSRLVASPYFSKYRHWLLFREAFGCYEKLVGEKAWNTVQEMESLIAEDFERVFPGEKIPDVWKNATYYRVYRLLGIPTGQEERESITGLRYEDGISGMGPLVWWRVGRAMSEKDAQLKTLVDRYETSAKTYYGTEYNKTKLAAPEAFERLDAQGRFLDTRLAFLTFPKDRFESTQKEACELLADRIKSDLEQVRRASKPHAEPMRGEPAHR